MTTIISYNFFGENICTVHLWSKGKEQVHRPALTHGLVRRTGTVSDSLRSAGTPARREKQAGSWLWKLHNQPGSLGQADPMTWECHMLSSQEPGPLKRKSIPESAPWPRSTNITHRQPMTGLGTPSFLVTPLLSKYSTVLLVIYTSFSQSRKKHRWM